MSFKKTSRRSPTLSDTHRSESGSLLQSRKVLVDDDELVRRAHSAESSKALHRALSHPVNSWTSRKTTPVLRLGPSDPDTASFMLLSRVSDIDGSGNEVLTTGSIACSPQELASALCSSNESDYNAAMKGLYGGRYIYGSVVHVVKGEQTQSAMPEGHQLAVRTSCFVRSRMFGRNEQWCFLEHFQPLAEAADTSQGFSVSLLSLSDSELAVGKVVGDRVDQLEEITAHCVVQPMENSNKVRVTFYAFYTGNNSPAAGVASAKTAQSRLLGLATGVSKLPVVLRRRRLGTQVFASSATGSDAPYTEAQNSRCISCTKGMRLSTLARFARRCQLCSYNVCTSCWTRESVETYNGHITQMGVCKRCLEWVDRCNYSHVQIERRGVTKIVDDPIDEPERPPSGYSLRETLTNEATKDAAVTVIKMLLSPQSTKSSSSEEEYTDEELDDRDDEGYMTAVQEYFHRRAQAAPSAENCELANASERTYPLELEESTPSAPVPENERARLKCIEDFGLMDLKGPMPELDIICAFLSQELGFFCTMITIVGETHQLVLSCTIPDMAQALLPREHTFCQHLLMGTAPFIIRHPEADVRFYNLNPVTKQGVKYYCGIPITGPDGVLVGSICCVHFEAMDITRSQYDALVRFGKIASKIIRVKAEAKLVL